MVTIHTLIHLIYSSTATCTFSEQDLIELLIEARTCNSKAGITGMLLYSEGSFFQILEGDKDIVDPLFAKIVQDKRHAKVVKIIREPIHKRSFADWTMGYNQMTSEEVGQIIGINDFFMQASCFSQIDSGRAKKLLAAFKEGRWRTSIKSSPSSVADVQTASSQMQLATMKAPRVSFAYQPIVDIQSTPRIVSFEALVRGLNNEPEADILQNINPSDLTHFDSNCRAIAIGNAVRLGLSCNLHLNFMARDIDDIKAAILSTLGAAERNKLDPSRIVLEINQDKLVGDTYQFGSFIEEFRTAGLKISIANFGAGRAGLNLLEPHRPEMLSLNENLVRGIESNGPQQAIVRGIAQTCSDLGIDIIVKNIKTLCEYQWFREEGFHLFQGDLFASPGFEKLPSAQYPID